MQFSEKSIDNSENVYNLPISHGIIAVLIYFDTHIVRKIKKAFIAVFPAERSNSIKATNIKTKLLTTLLTLCMVLSLAPISAFAEGVNYIPKVSVTFERINSKAGETPRATARVTEGNCTVAYEYWRELYQKEEGGV